LIRILDRDLGLELETRGVVDATGERGRSAPAGYAGAEASTPAELTAAIVEARGHRSGRKKALRTAGECGDARVAEKAADPIVRKPKRFLM